MKCPKCGYTSFDYLDACRKCGGDLREARSLLQIIAVSPDERGVLAGPSAPVPDELAAGPSFGHDDAVPSADFSEFADTSSSGGGGETLADLNFDESFADMVEPTSYQEPARPAPAQPTRVDEDEGLLDIDFGDVFGDKDAGKG